MSDKIHPAMISVMRRIRAIAKDRKNEQQRFMYRGIDDVYNAVSPLLSDAGIYTTSEIKDQQRDLLVTRNSKMQHVVLTIEYTFWAEDGSNVKTQVVGEGADILDKASNKAMAVADKYALLQAFKVPTEEMAQEDPDATDPVAEANKSKDPVKEVVPMVSDKEITYLNTMCGNLVVERDDVKRRFKIDSFKDIPKEFFDKVKVYILQKGAVNLLQIIDECETAQELSDLGKKLISWYPPDSQTRKKYDDRMSLLIQESQQNGNKETTAATDTATQSES